MHALRTGLLAVLALGLGLAACQAYNMEEVDPQTIIAVETFGTYVRSKPPALLVVQDRSGSMDACFDQTATGGATRGCRRADDTIDPTRRSRMEVAQDVMAEIVEANADEVQFGLVMYGYDPATPRANCGPPDTVAVPSGESHQEVAEAYRSSPAMLEPSGGTPTTAALHRAYEMLVDPDTGERRDPSRENYVVLVTDGLMNCNSEHPVPCVCASESDCGALKYGETGTPSNPIQCLDDAATIAEVERLRESKVPTFVIGLGDAFGGKSLATDVLDALAEAGGVPQEGKAQKFYSAADPAQLQASLEAIIKRISAPCDYELDGPVCDGRLVKVALRITEGEGDDATTEDVETSCSPDPGEATWYFASGDAGLDPQRIIFSPSLCKRLAEAAKVEISIRGVENACEEETGGPACSLAATP
ncbi:MAG TPA: vWA domain-containing protein [Vulgatibacter sp.]|nr:vWA domain-containing protein [Vulgatibacter sp.]